MIPVPDWAVWLVTLVLLGATAWGRYNTPPTKRKETTFLLFLIGGALYLVMLLVIWQIFYHALLNGGLRPLGLHQPGTDLAKLMPAVAALLLAVGMASAKLREMDNRARALCHRHAHIPGTAEQLGYELAMHTPFFLTRDDVARWAMPAVAEAGIPAAHFSGNPAELGGAEKAFLRAVVLRHKLLHSADAVTRLPAGDVLGQRARRELASHERALQAARKQYQALLGIARDYAAAEATRETIARELQAKSEALFEALCDILARVVLACEWTEGGRRARLQALGFDREYPAPSLSYDNLVAVLIVTMVPLLLLQLVLAGRGAATGCPPIGCGFAAAMVAVEFCVAAVTGTWVAYREHMRRLSEPDRAFPPLAAAALGACLALAASLLLRPVFRGLSLTLADPAAVGQLLDQLAEGARGDMPFVLFPAATSALVTLASIHLCRGRLRARHLAPVGALLGAAGLYAVGLVVQRMVAGAPPLLPAVAAVVGACFMAVVLPCFKLTLDAAARGAAGPFPARLPAE